MVGLFFLFMFLSVLFAAPLLVPNGDYLKRYAICMTLFFLLLSWHGSPLHPSSNYGAVCFFISLLSVTHFFAMFIRLVVRPWIQISGNLAPSSGSSIKYLLQPLFLVAGCCYLFFTIHEYSWFRSAIPSNIVIGRSIEIDADTHLFGGCGTAIFKLSSDSRVGVAGKGLDFFEHSLQPRYGYEARYRYEQWKETPLPDSWTSEGMWMGLSCSDANSTLLGKIVSAAKTDGSYYTHKNNTLLLVIPEQDIVVYSYFD